MALGRAQVQRGFQDPRQILGDRLREGSLYRLLADHGQQIFPDGYFADLYAGAVLAEIHDEWQVSDRRIFSEASMAKPNDPPPGQPPATDQAQALADPAAIAS